MKYCLLICLVAFSTTTHATAALATTWQVGATRQYKVPSSVMSLIADGDSVAIDSGLYAGDVGVWNNNNLVIYCPVGTARLNANGQIAQKKGIWVFYGNNNSVEGIEFYGAAISASDGNNGAGIRMQGSGLTLNNCYFHDNQDGILTSAGATSDIVIEACVFAHNGAGDGYSHNMYIGNVRSFTLRYCYIHEAVVGHEVKSRANNNYILYNRIVDAETGSASYDIDLPNGGRAIILGNSIMKGPQAQNHELIRYGEEGLINRDSELYVVNNTMLTELGNTTFITIATGAQPAVIKNNIFAGAGTIATGAVDTASNVHSSDTSFFHFKDVRAYDYRIESAFPGLGSTIGGVITRDGQSLDPMSEYIHPLDSARRSDFPLAVGAYPLEPSFVGMHAITYRVATSNFPNPFLRSTQINVSPMTANSNFQLDIFDQSGKHIRSEQSRAENGRIIADRGALNGGVYLYEISRVDMKETLVGKMVILP